MNQLYRHVANELYSPTNKVADLHYYKVGPIKNHGEIMYDLATECLDEQAQSCIYDTPPDAHCQSDNESDYATVRFE